MRTWPALDVGRLKPAPTDDIVRAGFSRLDLFQAALLDYEVAAVEERDADLWRVFFHTTAARDAAVIGLSRQLPALSLEPIDVPDEDWAARSQASLRAIRVGDLVIAPPWDVPGEVRLKPDTTYEEAAVVSGFSRTVIVIQPSTGFGTGHHATTRLCLAALQAIDLHGRSVLDIGTGSGVLAIAASRLGASPVVGIDDDPDAIRSAVENLALNADASVTFRTDDLCAATLPPHDIVTANLTGGLLIQTASRLQQVMAPPGRLILSGFLRDEEAGVRASYPDLSLEARTEEDEWVCHTLRLA